MFKLQCIIYFMLYRQHFNINFQIWDVYMMMKLTNILMKQHLDRIKLFYKDHKILYLKYI